MVASIGVLCGKQNYESADAYICIYKIGEEPAGDSAERPIPGQDSDRQAAQGI